MLSYFWGWELPGGFTGLRNPQIPSPVPLSPAGCWQLGAVFQDKAESSQGDANARDSPCVIWGKKSQYFQHCSLCFPSFPVPRQFHTLELQPGLGDLSTDHARKLMQSSPPPHLKPLGKHFPPEIGLERMSTNKGPFIPAGTAGRDTRAASALCLILCTRLGNGQRFSSFYILPGFSPFCSL